MQCYAYARPLFSCGYAQAVYFYRKAWYLMALFKMGKTKIPHRKNTENTARARFMTPSVVMLPMSQHIGAPSKPVVKVGDEVFVGTLIAEAGGYVGSPIYSSVSGKVTKIAPYLMQNGSKCDMVVITPDGNMTPDPSITPPTVTNFDEFRDAVARSGLVGLGGAGFPTAVKLDAEKKGLIKKIIVNGAECEPYITSDTRTMIEDAEDIKAGVLALLKYISADEVIIGIEKSKPSAIEKLTALFSGDERVSVVTLPSTYPQGAEKVLIFNTTGKIVPEGGLPADVGCLVLNITSVAFIAKYLRTGMPLVRKCVTLDGSAIKNPTNVNAPLGTLIKEIVEFAGGYKGEVGKLLLGGPMMGIAQYTDEVPIVKNTNAIVALSPADARPPRTTACIHCGRCVSACPIGLNPTKFAKAAALPMGDEAKLSILTEEKVNLCMECGCCSFVCPAKRPLVENNKLGKAYVRANQKR